MAEPELNVDNLIGRLLEGKLLLLLVLLDTKIIARSENRSRRSLGRAFWKLIRPVKSGQKKEAQRGTPRKSPEFTGKSGS